MKYNFIRRPVMSTIAAIIFTVCQFSQSSFAQSAENNTPTTPVALPKNAPQSELHSADGVDQTAFRNSIARAIDAHLPVDRTTTHALPSTNPGAPSSTAHQGNGKKKWIVIISAAAGVTAAVLLAGKKVSVDLSAN